MISIFVLGNTQHCAQGLNKMLVPSRDNEILLINMSRCVKPWNSNAFEYTLMCIYLYNKLCNLFQWETFLTTSTVIAGQRMCRQGCCSMVSRLLLLGADLTQQAHNCSYCYCRWLFHQLSGQIIPLGKSWRSEVAMWLQATTEWLSALWAAHENKFKCSHLTDFFFFVQFGFLQLE